MLGGGLSMSQKGLPSESSHLSSSALSSSQSESPLQTNDLLMHWPEHKKSPVQIKKKEEEEAEKFIESKLPYPPSPILPKCEMEINPQKVWEETSNYFGLHCTAHHSWFLPCPKLKTEGELKIPGSHPQSSHSLSKSCKITLGQPLELKITLLFSSFLIPFYNH